MVTYVFNRVLSAIPVMLFVALVTFGLLSLAPGDPAALLAGEDASAQTIARIHAALGLDQPFLQRFGHWVWRALHGDLGQSLYSGQSVAHMIGERLAPTLTLMVFTLVIAVLIAIPAGAMAAWRHNRWSDRVIMILSVFSFSLPAFVIGYALAWLFGLKLHWFPVQGYTPFSSGFWASLRSLVLPAVSLGSIYIGLIARFTRSTVIETLSQDYVRTARAKGVSDRQVLFRHALKNAAVPIVTVVGAGVALLISGTVVTEIVFAIPGVGRLTVDSILRRDYPVIQGVILLFSALQVVVNLGVDLLYKVFDPRIKY